MTANALMPDSPELEPIPMNVVRYKCPHCSRGHSKKFAAVAHMARCWKNPAVRSCRTCDRLTDIPAGGDCFPGRHCSCDQGVFGCAAGRAVGTEDADLSYPVTSCALWTLRRPDWDGFGVEGDPCTGCGRAPSGWCEHCAACGCTDHTDDCVTRQPIPDPAADLSPEPF